MANPIVIALPVDAAARAKACAALPLPEATYLPFRLSGMVLPCSECGMSLNVGPRTVRERKYVRLYCPTCAVAYVSPDEVARHLQNPQGKAYHNQYPKTPIEALQCKLAALACAEGGPGEFQRHYRHALEQSELFQWTAYTARQVLTASETYPLDPNAPYIQSHGEERLPGDQIRMPQMADAMPRLAVSLCTFDAPVMPLPSGFDDEPISALLVSPRFNLLDDADTPKRHYRFYGLDWNGGGQCRPVFAIRWPPSDQEHDDPYDDPAYINTLMRFLLTASQFVDQKICVESPAQLCRAGRKLAARASVSPVIKTIQLRAREQTTQHAGGSHIEYTCRWLVRGHWRKQFYPKTGDHRPVFIDTYVKGPADQPLKTPAPDVFVVNR